MKSGRVVHVCNVCNSVVLAQVVQGVGRSTHWITQQVLRVL